MKNQTVGAIEGKMRIFKKWWFWALISTAIVGVTVAIISSNKKTDFNLEETFEFNDFEITVESDFIYSVVDNEFADEYKKPAIGIPLKIKNLIDEPRMLSFLEYSLYGPSGTELKNVSAYFDWDSSIDFGGDIMKNVEATRYAFFTYEGKGEYNMVFDDFSDVFKVQFNA